MPAPPPPTGRFAPSPTGDLHVGSALAALGAWASARSQGGRFVWRVEDLDGPRAVPGAAERQMEDARWLGLDWDDGPDTGGPNGPYRQSERGEVYADTLRQLAQAGRLFPCRVSRSDLRALASAPHGDDGPGLPPYPASLRPSALAPDWFTDPAARADAALRFRVDPGVVAWDDGVLGPMQEDVAAAVGDVVLQRRDGVTAYQLAVVADDLAMGVTEVVRGQDLVGSTARQILLIRALGGAVPAYAHLPLVVAGDGAAAPGDAARKLSKRDGALTVRALRQRAVAATALVGWLAAALGQDVPARCTPAEVAAAFHLARVPRRAVVAPSDLSALLLRR